MNIYMPAGILIRTRITMVSFHTYIPQLIILQKVNVRLSNDLVYYNVDILTIGLLCCGANCSISVRAIEEGQRSGSPSSAVGLGVGIVTIAVVTVGSNLLLLLWPGNSVTGGVL